MYKIKAKRNIVYYQDKDGDLTQVLVYQEPKVTLKKAEELFKAEGIEYSKIISTKIEPITIEVPIKHIEKYIKEDLNV